MRLAFSLALLALVPSVADAADAKAGEAVFRKCQACHAVGEGAQTRLGPPLNGLIGRKAGTEEGFAYSDAMKNAGWVWDEPIFKEYITDPKKKVPGNKMLFPGVKDETERDDLYAYLASFALDGSPKK